MAKTYNTLDQHFNLPHVRQVDTARPFQWLRLGWDDMRDNLPASLAYGLFFAVLGYLILAYAANMPYLFTAAVSGFFLVGPLAAAGLYELSRQRGAGRHAGLVGSLKGLAQHKDALLYYGLFLAIVLVSWERLSAILFALFYAGNVPDLGNFFRDVFLSGNYLHFLVAYIVIGGALAGLVFALSAVSLPMLMDRDVDIITAMMTSARAVGKNIGVMFLWGGLIVALIGIGFATFMIGMVVTLPLVGHASWHAYKDLID
jgi:uncharacterized membrane protein